MPVLGDCDGLPVIPEFTVWKQEPSKAIGMTKQGKTVSSGFNREVLSQ